MAFRKITADYGVEETLDKDGKLVRAQAVLKKELQAQLISNVAAADAIQSKLDILAAE